MLLNFNHNRFYNFIQNLILTHWKW